jgi:hypothetical protein
VGEGSGHPGTNARTGVGTEAVIDRRAAQGEGETSPKLFTNALLLVKLRKELPTAHVHAMCHAVYRWDKKRKFDGNDLLDFHHATAALAYCDVFLTDGPLRALLTSTHVDLNKKMDCAVISDIGEAG